MNISTNYIAEGVMVVIPVFNCKNYISDAVSSIKKQPYKKIIIIHGKGSHIVKQSVHQELNKNQYVEDYKLDNFNDGITVVSLKVDK